MLRPIEPLESELSSKFLKEQIELTASDTVIQKQDYTAEGAHSVNGLAPYLECWKEHRGVNRLPSLRDFNSIWDSVGLSAVHLVETPTDQHGDFRFVNFDCSTRLDGHDFSGTYLSGYPDDAFRQAARLDYSASVATGQACLARLDFRKRDRSGGLARLVLPISDDNGANPSKLLVVLRILEHQDVASGVARALAPGSDHATTDSHPGEAQDRIDDPAAIAAGQIKAAQALAEAIGGEELVMRYFQSGIHEQLPDHDLLEWLLRQFLGSKDSEALAGLLIKEFGSLPAVLAMGRERLSDFPSLTAQALLSLKVVRELATRLIKTETMSGPLVSDARQVVDYCRARMAHETVEHLRILYLDQKNRLIRDEIFHGGGVSSVSVNPRQIVKRAILLDAKSIIMAHNHPSGDPSPSAADVDVTRDVKRAAEAIDIRLLDHLIIGRSGSVSLRTLGYLDGAP